MGVVIHQREGEGGREKERYKREYEGRGRGRERERERVDMNGVLHQDGVLELICGHVSELGDAKNSIL